MARPTPALVDALRETAQRLDAGAAYAWTHMGRCNCGHLAQTITRLSPAEIHRQALVKPGDWTEQAAEYCSDSGLSMDRILTALLDSGLTTADVADLEKLRNDRVLRRLPADARPLDHRRRAHVVLYLRAWADLLDEQLDRAADHNEAAADPGALARSGHARRPVRVRY